MSEDLVDAIDQLDTEFSEKLGDICISKAEVIAVVERYLSNTETVEPSEELEIDEVIDAVHREAV